MLAEGSLFVAIPGDRFDGNDFVEEAFAKGAAGALVSRLAASQLPQIEVRDSRRALGAMGRAWRASFSIPVVGVTTVLSFAVAWLLRLNQPVIQTINWSSYALQLLLIIPFIRLGEAIFHAPRMSASLEELLAIARADPLDG